MQQEFWAYFIISEHSTKIENFVCIYSIQFRYQNFRFFVYSMLINFLNLKFQLLLNLYFMKQFLLIILFVSVFTASDYRISNITQNSSTIVLALTYTGNDTYYIKPTSPIIKNLVFTFHCYSLLDFYFKITDINNTRFEIPNSGIFPIDPLAGNSFPITASAITFSYTANPFDFKIVRKIDNTVLFDTSQGKIIFSDYYLEITTSVPSQIAYGFGERFSDRFRLKEATYTIFNRDRASTIDRGKGEQTYGYYPIYLLRQNSGQFHLNYFRSTNAMDVVVKNNSDNTAFKFTYKVIGGVIDYRFFLGQLFPQTLIERFQLYSGRSAIPPFWSFGFHQSRWGYANIIALQNVINGYESNDIPLDTIWTDIDYMKDYEDFTIDQARYPLDKMNKILQKYRYIPIIDAGVKINNGTAYNEGQKRNVFLKDADGKQYLGRVWPGDTAFVDFFHPNATRYWEDMLTMLYNKVQFSGVWLDMNQIANFCNGPCVPPTTTGFDYSHDLPYNPGVDGIEAHTISLNATHYGGVKQANFHVYFGYLQAFATNLFLESKDGRPFIISRSSTVGFNKYGFHWTGDNYADFEFLKISIANNFMFQFWGVNMVGADICGFAGNTNEQLCARWFQLGSLYPFARNHNQLGSIDQQAYALGPIVLQSSKVNLKLRYSILKFYYRHFINKRGLGTIFKPLWIDFPQDLNTFNDSIAETQFIIGTQLMAAPIVVQDTEYRSVYFPFVNWYSFQTGRKYAARSTAAIQNTLTDQVPLFIREGNGLLIQDTTNVRQTNQLLNVFILKAALVFQERNSTADNKRYTGVAGTLSIKDFNNDTNIELCLRAGCEYTFRFLLSLSAANSYLQIDTVYTGAQGLNEQQIIKGVELFFDGGSRKTTFETPISIRNSGRVSVPIPNNEQVKVRNIEIQE